MRLQQTIADWEAEHADQSPPSLRILLDRSARDLSETGVDKRVLGAGELCRDFRLGNARGTQIPLAGMLMHGAVVLSFQRGIWCPYARLEFEALNAMLPEFARRGATLVGITPDPPDMTAEYIAAAALDFEVLCDPDNRVAKRYRLVTELPEALAGAYRELGVYIPGCDDGEGCELPMPATYIITPGGRIHAAFVHPDPRQRSEPDEILSSLDQLGTQKSTRAC